MCVGCVCVLSMCLFFILTCVELAIYMNLDSGGKLGGLTFKYVSIHCCLYVVGYRLDKILDDVGM